MGLRLVLVGVVVSLGLTLPSEATLDRWSHSGPGWWTVRLFEWESKQPVDDDAFVFVADAVEVVPPPTPASAPIPELNQPIVAEATPVPDAPAPVVVTAPAPVAELEPAPIVTAGPAPVVAVDDLDKAAVLEEWVLASTPPTVEPVDPAGRAWLEARIREWTILPGLDAIVAETTAAEVAAAPPAEAAPAPVDEDRAFAAVVEEMVATFTEDEARTEAARVAESTTAPSVVPNGDPLAADDDLYPGMAFALNRGSEGLSSAEPVEAPASAVPATDPSEVRFANALRLTREAVQAWANLLHGPAVMTITR